MWFVIEAGAPPGTNVSWNQLEGHRPRCPRVQMFRAWDVAGFNTGTEAGAPPGTNVSWNQLEGHRPRCPRVQIFRACGMSRVLTRAPRPVPRQVRMSRGFNWRGTGPGAHGYECCGSAGSLGRRMRRQEARSIRHFQGLQDLIRGCCLRKEEHKQLFRQRRSLERRRVC